MSRQTSNARAPIHRGPLVLLGDGLLLLMALTGSGFSLLTAYGLGADPRILLGGCALFALLSLAAFSLPRFRWAALLVLLEAAALAAWQMWGEMVTGARCVQYRLAQALSNGTWSPPEEASGLLAESGWAETCFLLLILALLALLLGWAVVRIRSHWATFALTCPLLLPAFLVNRLPAWPAFLSLLVCWCAMLLSSLCVRKDRWAGARLTLTAIPALAAAFSLLTLALPRETYAYPAWARRAQTALRSMDWEVVLPDFLPSFFSGAGSSAVIDLAGAGPLHYSGRTVLRVETSVSGWTYFRGRSAGVYTGDTWVDLEDEVYQELGELPGGYEPLNFPALTDPDGVWKAVTVENLGAPGGCLYLPYYLLTDADEVVGAAFVEDAYLARGLGTWRHTLYYRPDAGPWWDMTPLGGTAAEAERVYREFVYNHYLEIPEGFSDILAEWIERTYQVATDDHIVVGDGDPETEALLRAGMNYQNTLAEARMVRALLAATTEYDPGTAAMPAGADFVDHFLNETQRGYCMHYASAGALILRFLGIPARYVSGFAATVPESGRLDITDENAHAWVEVYLPGYGWYPVEMTPGYSGLTDDPPEEGPGPTPTPGAGVQPAPTSSDRPSAEPEPSPGPAEEDSRGETGGREDAGEGSAPAWILGLALLAVLLAALVRWGLLHRRWMVLGGPDTNQAVLAAYRVLLRLAPWGGREDPEVTALAQKARFSPHIITEEERRSALEGLRREARRVEAALPPCKRAAFRLLWGNLRVQKHRKK